MKTADWMVKVCNGAHSNLARAIHLYVVMSPLYQSVLRLMPFLTVYFR